MTLKTGGTEAQTLLTFDSHLGEIKTVVSHWGYESIARTLHFICGTEKRKWPPPIFNECCNPLLHCHYFITFLQSSRHSSPPSEVITSYSQAYSISKWIMLVLLGTSAPLVLCCDRFHHSSRQVKSDPVNLVTEDYDISKASLVNSCHFVKVGKSQNVHYNTY